jgi:geranylgeranyl reductase
MPDIYDVIVVGGGPSGSVAARTLAAAGVKVFLIERNLKRVKSCGGATPSKSFEEFNIPQKVIGRKIETVSTISPSGDRIDQPLNSGYLAMVERDAFDHSLRKQAEKAGADLTEAEFLGIKEAGQKICITVAEKGKEREVSSDFLIAADGVNSMITRAVGLKPLPTAYTIQEEVDMKAAEDFQEIKACEFWFGLSHAPNFYSWVFPKKDYVDIGTGAVNGRILKDLMKKFKERRRIFGKGKQRIYRVPLKWRNSLVKGNILFVGESAGLIMPFSYEGIYYAMKSGKMAAEAIVANNPKDFERQWNKKLRRQFKLMQGLKKYFLRSDRTIEQMFKLHKKKKVQEASMRLWFEKDLSMSGFLIYLSFFKKILS